jgi:hypothetical protein
MMMHFIQLNEQGGINLAHVIEWYELPGRYDNVASVTVVFTAASEHADGQRQPHSRTYVGAEREAFLKAVRLVVQNGEDWQTAYEETRDELRMVTRRLHIFEEQVNEEEQRRIWDLITSRERGYEKD